MTTQTPKLRFPEFFDKWEVKKVGEICDFIVPGRNKPTSFEGNIPWITTPDISNNTIVYNSKIGLSISKEEAKKVGSKIVPINSIIISCVGDLGLVAISGKEMVLNQQLHAFLPRETIYYKFLLYGLSIQKKYMDKVATKTAVPYMNKDNCNSIPISLPKLPEQTKIANFLTAIDEKIQALKQKKTLLEQYKKGIMQQIFSQELRFKEDDGADFDDWEEKSLGEITLKTDKKNKDKEVLPVYSISNKNGFVHQSEQFDGVDSVERGYDTSLYKIVESGTFAYNPARINVGSIGYSGNLERVLVSSLYVCFKTINTVDNQFFSQFLGTKHFNDSVNRSSEGGIRLYLFYENFSQIKINLPTLHEQQKIASFLIAVDEKIEKVNEHITTTETYKKGLLQQMFI